MPRSSRRPGSAHQELAAARLAQLSEQLASADLSPASEPIELAPAVAPAAGGEWWSAHTRVAAPRPLVVVPDPDPEPAGDPEVTRPPTLLPVPGRHASRRPRAPAALLPDTLRGTVRIGAAQLTVVAVVVALGLAVLAWWAVRGRPDAGTPVTAAPAPALVPATATSPQPLVVPSSAPGSAGGASAGATPARLTVDVAGRVRHPGIVVLPDGARVVDAVRRAGGARPGVDLTPLNLARPLVDGEQIVVGTGAVAPAAQVPSGAAATTAPTPTAPVDLNTATAEQLDALPDVGPVTAAAILAWRQEHGRFTTVSELLEVDGIGDVTLAKLTPLVTV